MAKNNNKTILYIIIAVLIILLFMKSQGVGPFSTKAPETQPQTPYPKEIIKEFLTYNANLDINPNTVCVGDSATGTITSNIPNGICSVFYDDGTGYTFYNNVNLNSAGSYSESQVMAIPGTLIFIAVCCDVSGNCKLSNTERIITQTCDTDGDGIPDDTDPDDDNDGYPDEVEIEEGTDPKDLDSYPGIGELNCDSECVNKGYYTGRSAPSCSNCMYPPEICNPIEGYNYVCCCTPESEPELPMTSAECDNWAVQQGRKWSVILLSEASCESFATSNCNAWGGGLVEWNYLRDCCIYSCVEDFE